jgi:hypothetical protein
MVLKSPVESLGSPLARVVSEVAHANGTGCAPATGSCGERAVGGAMPVDRLNPSVRPAGRSKE